MIAGTSPIEFFQEEKNRIFQQLYPERQGGEAYGGDFGGREADRMRSGGAPFTGKGLLQGLGNAMSILGGSGAITMGAASLGELATGSTPGSWGGLSNIEGHFKYDQDLQNMVRNSRNPQFARIEADRMQRERNARKQGMNFANSMKNVDAARHRSRPGGFSGLGGGGGAMNSGARNPGNTGRDPTPGKAGR